MRLLLYGLGRSGLAAAQLAHRQGHELWYYDQRLAAHDAGEMARLAAAPCPEPSQAEVDICIAAPGVPWDHPDLLALRQRGIEVIGEVEWVYRTVPAEIVGITGTAGKTTVTRWLGDVLAAGGVSVAVGGNIDPALAAVAEPGKLLVAELSSFMLERCPTLKPKLAVLLNLGVDHLDRHGSVCAYYAAKRQLIANLDEMSALVYNQDDPQLQEWARTTPASTYGYSLTHPTHAWLKGETLMLLGQPLLATSELRLHSRHFQANALAVALAASVLGLDTAAIRQGLRSFAGVAGRYSLVAQVEGIRFIEDSIATRTLAVQAALAETPAPVVWIAGGVDKGADLASLQPLIQDRVALFIGIGQSGPDFAARVSGWTRTLICPESDGKAALRSACSLAIDFLHRHHHGQGSVLLAPLAASFDQFADYRARAAAFREAVEEAIWTRP
ncbi:MAG: UDP-N-acetylmuramoyl-L-alanine--D-glutamate ligase [Truepera sp.]|nr:UDP-N-acetylmuramoyl-L-alanine--D-glutamate ligase [Truepera sp.]